ncbi:zf-HC2 domain-containing protein [Streptomyces sp. TRM66268-LWL]|uniref:Zf-HC2 domain-containing protein n=1 Tax=Streptomyces polyasparticus TaxID=2767826 RepID=A0ABR7SHL3_9ACTN|nr:zf-HC2 domain-containing protein [Streptomyces polyasparticus]MBC9713803.1 zf-HC2 domain-containing protein [Streptomyces polyasparticus]
MSAQHQDVAAYALGVLEPADSLHVEEHLDSCPHCALELAEFSRVVTLLEPLTEPDALPYLQAPPAPLLDRLLGLVRRRRRTVRLRLVAAVAAVLFAVPAGVMLLRDDGPPVLDGRAGTITASVTLDEQPWGTGVALRMDGLDGPLRCELVAVGPGGTEQTVLTWSVPPGGYGFPGRDGHERPLLAEGGTGMRADQIRRFEVRTLDGVRLLSLPAG